jgi:hypothetical protein
MFNSDHGGFELRTSGDEEVRSEDLFAGEGDSYGHAQTVRHSD